MRSTWKAVVIAGALLCAPATAAAAEKPVVTTGGASSIDALGVHAYLGSFEPSVDAGCTPLCFGQVEEFRAVMQRHGATRPLYITEFGALESDPPCSFFYG